MKRRYQIFVSSTYKDLIDHRQMVIKSLMQVNAIPAGMEQFPAADDDAWSIIKRTIDESDYYLVLIGGRYGSTDKNGLSYTENEYDYANQRGLPIMAFLHGSPATLPRDQTETDEQAWKKLESFRAKAQKRHCKYWNNPTELMMAVLTSYHMLIETRPVVGWVRGDQAKTVEDLEKVIALQDRVKHLEAELASIRTANSQQANLPKDDELMKFPVSNQETSHSVEIPWREVWLAVGSSAADVLSDSDIQRRLELVIAEHCKFEGVPALGTEEWREWEQATNFLSTSEWENLRRLLTSLELIEVDTRQVQQPAGYDFASKSNRYETRTQWFCRLTPLGRQLLARLLRRQTAEPQTVPAAT